MKRISLILLIAAFAYSLTSCKEKTASEKFKDKMEEAGEDIKEESKKVEEEAK